MSTKLPSAPSNDVPPISRESLKSLFDYLDRPNPPACTHTFAETISFLKKNDLEVDKTLEWLKRNGCFCDCEVIYNTDAAWGEYAGRVV